MGHLGNLFDVADRNDGIARRFNVYSPGVRSHGIPNRLRICGVHQTHFHPEARQMNTHQLLGARVAHLRGNYMIIGF